MARKIGKTYFLGKGCGYAGGQVYGHAVELGANSNKGIMANMTLGRGHNKALPFDYAMQWREADDSCGPYGNEGQRAYPSHSACALKVSGNMGNVSTMPTMPSIDTRLERSTTGTFQGKMRQTGLMTIEAKEYRCLLGLYYAAYDEAKNPSASTEATCLQALETCNDFYADGDVWP